MASRNWSEQLLDIASDLTTLEINTIESTGITGRKMPPWPHALIDIAQKYADFLTGDRVRLDLDDFVRRLPNEDAGKATFLPRFRDAAGSYDLVLANGTETFDRLRWAAVRVLDVCADATQTDPAAPMPEMDESTLAILVRIKRSCDQLKAATEGLAKQKDLGEYVGQTRAKLHGLKDLSPPRAPAHVQTSIRKTWDIGTDRIMLQTVMQLDGDVVYRAGRQAALEHNRMFLEAHERGADMALRHWHGLFDLVIRLISGGGGRFLGGR